MVLFFGLRTFFCPLLIFQMRASGDPYLQHCVETAILLAMIGASSSVVAAGLLHDTLDDSSMTYDYIFQTFGAEVADLVKGVWDIIFKFDSVVLLNT